MPRINLLPLNLRNKIAAGEVVERPASVVKELIENSIDAGASRIEIDAIKAGRVLIKVSDSGIGMDREDALLAFERYATSKIKDEDDLFNIMTMGFRGEALSSIASVSRVKMVTSYQNGVGTCIEIIGGVIKEVKDCPAIGTTIEVRDLFFNTPARRKFLKSDSTENYHIIDVVTREAVAHYQIGFVLRMDGDTALDLPPALSLRERLVQIFGKDFVDDLIETGAKDNHIGIRAFLGKTTNLRGNRNNQFLFINNRTFRDQSIAHAVYKAYGELIPKDKHPVFFIFLEIDPRRVDFNVHPTKREVRFEDKNGVFDAVYQTAKEALRGGSRVMEYRGDEESIEGISQYPNTPPLQDPVLGISEPLSIYGGVATGTIPAIYLGDTFVAVPEKGGITIIDYHAAHERINYERLLRCNNTPSYRLLFPQQIKLQSSEYRAILYNLEVLSEMGFEVEDFGHATLIIRSLPEFLKDADLDALMSDMAVALINECQGLRGKGQGNGMPGPIDSAKKILAARLACHKSLRGREVPDGVRIAQLLKDLESADNPDSCPHGRPTRIFISQDELRKMFKK